jgi:hypothetical protein
MKKVASIQWKDEGTYKEPLPATDNIRVPRLEIDGDTTYIDKDGGNNMTFTDAVSGTVTLASLVGTVAALDDLSDVAITSAERGDVLFRDATGWVNLHHGNANDVLTSGGNGADVSWAAPAAGGDITTDAAWAAKGDLIVATGNDAAAILTVGAEDTMLMVQSGTPAWVAAAAAGEIVGVAAAAEGSANNFARSDHTHQIQHAISDNHIVTVDDASAADDDFARFTANGIEGLSASLALNALGVVDTSIADHAYWGLTLAATAHENIAITDVCFMNSDGEWAIADADAEATTKGLMGMATAAANAAATCTCLVYGLMRDDDGWGGAMTKGSPYFLHTTSGDVTSTAPSGSADCVRIVGFAQAARVFFFNPANDWGEIA